jgi:hypothetical protein
VLLVGMRGMVDGAKGVLILLLVALTAFVSADSSTRNPLIRVGVVRDAVIQSPKHRISALSTFDLDFDLESRRIRLHLEPNHDIIPDGAQVNYLNNDGSIARTEALNRLDHKVFKGTAKVQKFDGEWMDVGGARISVLEDGSDPIFRGTFQILGDSHHVLTSSHYAQTKEPLDPEVTLTDEEYMIIFRDSDVADEYQRTELLRKRGITNAVDPVAQSCQADTLLFNRDPKHPIFNTPASGPVPRGLDSFWGGATFNSLFSRQLDTSPGSGNSAGVNLKAHIGSTAGCPTTRKVALVGVATDCTYTGSFDSEEDMRKAVIDAMNSASSLYESTFDISLALRNLTVMPSECPGEPQSTTPWNVPCSSSTNIQDRLNLFSQWRGEQKDGNSHWTLLTLCKTGPAVGLSWLGQACKVGSSSNGDSSGETVAGANVVAKTSTEWQVIA